MCNTPILIYRCGCAEPTKRMSRCDTAIDNRTHCKPQPKRYQQRGLCTECTVKNEAQRLEQSIQQTRQKCLRLGATPAQMASIQPTYEQVKRSDRGYSYRRHTYDDDSGYGSDGTSRTGSQDSGYESESQYSKSPSGASSEYSASLASSRSSGSRPTNHYRDRQYQPSVPRESGKQHAYRGYSASRYGSHSGSRSYYGDGRR